MKDRLATPSYCFILAANFLLYFGFWLLIPVLPFYLSEVFRAGNSTIGIILSYRSTMHPPILRLSARFFCTKTTLSAFLFHIYQYFRRLYRSRKPHLIYNIPYYPRGLFWDGNGRRKYCRDRHHAFIKARGGIGVLRTDK